MGLLDIFNDAHPSATPADMHEKNKKSHGDGVTTDHLPDSNATQKLQDSFRNSTGFGNDSDSDH